VRAGPGPEHLKDVTRTCFVDEDAIVASSREVLQIRPGPPDQVRLMLLTKAPIRVTDELGQHPASVPFPDEPRLFFLQAGDFAVHGVHGFLSMKVCDVSVEPLGAGSQ
jgi:hypothetical protein